MRDRECSNATVDWERSTHASRVALYSPARDSVTYRAMPHIHAFGDVAADSDFVGFGYWDVLQ